ncbi:unnamed protein product, partial [Meganyctiphanes norvegica]
VLTTLLFSEVVLARSDNSDRKRDDASTSALDPKIGSRHIIPANLSVPFSVAPQPQPMTPAVAHARQQFLKTFALIEEAVKAADTAHQPLISARGDVNNNLDHSSNTIAGNNASAIMTATGPRHSNSPVALSRVGPIEQVNEIIKEVFDERAHIFPDEETEPEYFLPKMKVDPRMLLNLDTPMPLNAWIQDITPMGIGANGGMCYEIVILEPEPMFNLGKFRGRTGSSSQNIDSTIASAEKTPTEITGLRASSRSRANTDPISTSQPKNSVFNTLSTQGGGLPIISPHVLVGTPVLSGLAAGSAEHSNSQARSGSRIPDTHSAVLQAVATSLNSTTTARKIPPHFVVPQLPFVSFFQRTG